MVLLRHLLPILPLFFSPAVAKATLPDPLFHAYWGQSGSELTLKEYCSLGYFNLIAIGFVDHFGATPFAFNTDSCSSTAASPSTCSSLASQISYCQQQGVLITVSLGGATASDCGAGGCTGDYYFSTSSQATATATLIWETFFNGGKTTSGVTRPFGSVVVDGIDLDIEMTLKADGQSPQMYYDKFVNALLAYDSSIIVGAAPECEYGDNSNPMEGAVSNTPFDYLFVQFFNNAKCSASTTNFNTSFSTWAGVTTSNSNGGTHLLLGLPGNSAAALLPSYYLSSAETISTVQTLRNQYPNVHLGVGVWDAYASTSGDDPNWAKDVAAGLKTLKTTTATTTSSSASSASQNHTVALSTSSIGANATSTKSSTSTSLKQDAISTGSSSSSSSSKATSTSSTGGSSHLGVGWTLIGLSLSTWIGLVL